MAEEHSTTLSSLKKYTEIQSPEGAVPNPDDSFLVLETEPSALENFKDTQEVSLRDIWKGRVAGRENNPCKDPTCGRSISVHWGKKTKPVWLRQESDRGVHEIT